MGCLTEGNVKPKRLLELVPEKELGSPSTNGRKLTMSRRTVCCQEKHTPLAPYKNDIRATWMRKIPLYKDIITISHGALDVLNILGWKGRIQVCDIDPGVREATEYLRGDYPRLNILSPGESIKDTTIDYCLTYGVKKLGAVDVDLAVGIVPAWKILAEVLEVLRDFKFHGKVFLTFRNGRDRGFGKAATQNRINWLWLHLSLCGVKYVSHTNYRSVRCNDNASRSVGSAMCIVELDM